MKDSDTIFSQREKKIQTLPVSAECAKAIPSSPLGETITCFTLTCSWHTCQVSFGGTYDTVTAFLHLAMDHHPKFNNRLREEAEISA